MCDLFHNLPCPREKHRQSFLIKILSSVCKRERHTQIDGIPRTNEKQDEELLEKERKKKDDKGHLKTIRKKSDWINFNTTQRLM